MILLWYISFSPTGVKVWNRLSKILCKDTGLSTERESICIHFLKMHDSM